MMKKSERDEDGVCLFVCLVSFSAVPEVEVVPDGVLDAPEDEERGDVGNAQKHANGGQGRGPGLEPPGQLLLAPEGVLGADDRVPALPGHGLVGVDEVVGAVRAAAANLKRFFKSKLLCIEIDAFPYIFHDLLQNSGRSWINVPLVDKFQEHFIQAAHQNRTLLHAIPKHKK